MRSIAAAVVFATCAQAYKTVNTFEFIKADGQFSTDWPITEGSIVDSNGLEQTLTITNTKSGDDWMTQFCLTTKNEALPDTATGIQFGVWWRPSEPVAEEYWDTLFFEENDVVADRWSTNGNLLDATDGAQNWVRDTDATVWEWPNYTACATRKYITEDAQDWAWNPGYFQEFEAHTGTLYLGDL